jgi:hypothetical protein
MRRLSARVVVVVVCLSLLALGVPARSKPREDISIPASVNGANGMLTFHFNDAGEIQFIDAYAGTADWSQTGFWSATGGWTWNDVTFIDPELVTIDGQNSTRNTFSTAYDWIGRSPDDPAPIFPPPPTDYPLYPSDPLPTQKTCQVCVDELRAGCQRTWRAESVGAVAAGGVVTAGCYVVTATTGFAVCIVGGIFVTGTAVWIARTHFRQCWDAAPLTCVDPATGKQCYQLGY